MKQMDVTTYRRVNESFCKRLVYHVGANCGFFVEMNYMVNAMLYCLAHRIQFQMYSKDANFGTGLGWTEYFYPFCKEVSEPYHAKYNFHRPPSWKRVLKGVISQRSFNMAIWKIKLTAKTIIGRVIGLWIYKERIYLGQDVLSITDTQFSIPELGIDGDYISVYGIIAKMIWKLRPVIVSQELEIKSQLLLPASYSGVHVRGGDKASEAQLISGYQIISALHPKDGDCIFTLTDNYTQLQMIRSSFPKLRILSLCQPYENGYYHKEFIALSSQKKKESIIRLLISADILLQSAAFIGTITSGPSVFIMKVRAEDSNVKAIDCPEDMFPDCLSLNIDVRSAISRLTISRSYLCTRL